MGLSNEPRALEIMEVRLQSEFRGFDLVRDTRVSDTRRAKWSIPSATAATGWARAAGIIRCLRNGLGVAVLARFTDPFGESISTESAAIGLYVGTKGSPSCIPPSAALVRFRTGDVLCDVDSVVCATHREDPGTALVRARNPLCDRDFSSQITFGVGLEECGASTENLALDAALDRLGSDARCDWGVYRIFVFREIHRVGRRCKLVVAARVSSTCPVLHSLR